MAIIADYTPAEAAAGGPPVGAVLRAGQATAIGQSVQAAAAHRLTAAKFYLSKTGNPTGNAYAKLYASTGVHGSNAAFTGAALATSDAFDVTTIATTGGSYAQRTLPFSGLAQIDVDPGVTYVLMIEYAGGDASNYINVLIDFNAPVDPGNMVYVYEGSTLTYSAYDTIFSLEGTLLTPPVANFNASPTSGNASLNVTFTDTSTNTPTSWLWDFNDGTTSTLQNPSHSFSTGFYNVVLTATNADGSSNNGQVITVNQALIQTSTLSNPPTVYAPTLTTADPPPPPPTDWSAIGRDDDKEFLYKVYDSDNVYVGAWQDVKDPIEFSQQINSPGTTTVVKLARSGNTRLQTFEALVDEAANTYVDESGNGYSLTSDVPNTVGPGTDVELNYRVDVYVTYGGFDTLVDESGNAYVDEDGNSYVTSYGAPNGTRIFSGFILDYDVAYGDTDGVSVTLASFGWELSHEVIKNGSDTTVTFTTNPIETTVKSILDTNAGVMTYTTDTIDVTGVSPTLKFQLNTKLEGIESAFKQTNAGWYWYGNVAENLLYLQERGITADHTFALGQHIKGVSVKRSIETLVNEVYFVGGNTTPGDDSTMVFKHYTDAPSQTAWRKALRRIVDRRYTVTSSIDNYANGVIDEADEPLYTTPLTISAGRYDIETISLGQMVGFANFGNFIDDLVLQIVSLSYSPYAVTVELGTVQSRQIDTVAEVEESLNNEQFEAVPTTPS